MRRLALCIVALAGCYAGVGRRVDPSVLNAPGWQAVSGVPVIEQKQELDCGAAAAAMVLAHWQRPTTTEAVWSAVHPRSGRGISAGAMRDFLRARGLEAYLVAGTLTDLHRELGLGHPVVVGVVESWGREGLTHYEVVIGVHLQRRAVVTLDPARGAVERDVAGFLEEWGRSRYVMIAAWDPARPPG
jgi:ABC-type bacteriocin/lantibiotic exporter with double-glycine peptidase domain